MPGSMMAIKSLHMYCKVSQLNCQGFDIYVMLDSTNAGCRMFIAGTAFARYLTIHMRTQNP